MDEKENTLQTYILFFCFKMICLRRADGYPNFFDAQTYHTKISRVEGHKTLQNVHDATLTPAMRRFFKKFNFDLHF